MTRSFRILYTLVILLMAAMSPIAAQQGDDNQTSQEPYSVVLTHYGGEYKVRFTIEGASGIEPSGQGVGSDFAHLEGHAAPDGTITVTMEWVACNGSENDLEWKNIDVKMAQSALGALGLTFEEITKEMYRTVFKIG